MRPDQFQLELAAAESYVRLLNEARNCRNMHINAGVTLPTPLLRLFGEEQSGPRQLSLGIMGPHTDPSRNETKPDEANDDWISLWAKDASPTTIALAILRNQERPIKAKELVDLVAEILPNAVGGSIYNLLNRLQSEGYVSNRESGWMLVDRSAAGILSREFIWAPHFVLSKTDLAAHRREAIMYFLGIERYLQVMQIVEKLHEAEWVKAPVSKDLLKTDMQVLEEQGLARRIGNTRNWEAVPK